MTEHPEEEVAPKAEVVPQKSIVAGPPVPSDEAIEDIRKQRFNERVQRVLEVMQQERIDWQGRPIITPDGRIEVKLYPVEIPKGPVEP